MDRIITPQSNAKYKKACKLFSANQVENYLYSEILSVPATH